MQGLSRGGTEWTLVEALNVINYDKYDVTLYIRKNMQAMVPLINEKVNILVNDNVCKYEKTLYYIWLEMLSLFFRSKKMQNMKKKINKKKRSYILHCRKEYEKKRYFADNTYDLAIAYDMAKDCSSFVKDCVKAKEKAAFFHGSNLEQSKAEIYYYFDKIVTVNALVAKKIKTDYPLLASKVSYIENFTDVEKIKEYSKKMVLDKPKCKLVLSSCGRMTGEKGFDIAVQAAGILKSKNIDFIWYFVGDGIEREKIEARIVKDNLEKNIILTGFQNNPYTYITMSDIYVQPSLEESFGMTILEAIILGKPIVSTNTLGGQRLAEKYNCISVCDIEPTSMANEIINLYQDVDMRKQYISYAAGINWEKERESYAVEWNRFLDSAVKNN